jgi:CRP/FNR family transcriptional regulator, cyclic AMP receptor protein
VARSVLPREAFAIGQMVFKAGDPPRFAYLLQSGVVEVVLEDGTVVSTLEAGAIFGEMALIEDSPRSAGVRATEAANCILITRQEFERRLEKSDPFVRSMLKILAQRLRVTNEN